MKSSSSIEKFQVELNIPLSIRLWFLEEKDMNLGRGSDYYEKKTHFK